MNVAIMEIISGFVLMGLALYILISNKKIGRCIVEKEKQKAQADLERLNQINQKAFESQKEIQAAALQAIKEKNKIELQTEIDEWKRSAQEAATEYSNILIAENKKLYNEKLIELMALQDEVTEFHAKRAALNESIRIEQELQNSEMSHRIQLSEFDIEDIGFLNSISNKVHNKEILSKLIWSTYLQKPFNEMINRLFGSNIPKNVVYCIQNINTQEKYIGKTTSNVKDRWANHIKSSLGIGTLSNQKIHEALNGNWNNFSFSIIEEVDPDQKLSDREKFYIEMFESHVYGYNMKV